MKLLFVEALHDTNVGVEYIVDGVNGTYGEGVALRFVGFAILVLCRVLFCVRFLLCY